MPRQTKAQLEEQSMAGRHGQAERFSKLQKFILTAAYTKTCLKQPLPKRSGQLEKNARKPQTVDETGIAALTDLDREMQRLDELKEEIYFSALYEVDIMANFYNRETWTDERYTGGSNKEKTAIRRSLATLQDRGYINEWKQWSIHAGEVTGKYGSLGVTHEMSYQSRAIITLTPKGIEAAKGFLKVVQIAAERNIQL